MTLKKKIIFIYSIILLALLIFILSIFKFGGAKYKSNLTVFDNSMMAQDNFVTYYINEDKKNLIFLSFDCEHCTDAIKKIKDKKGNFEKGKSFIFIFNEDEKTITEFVKNNADLLAKGICVYNDKNGKLFSALQVKSYPTIFKIKDNKIINSGSANTLLPSIFGE